jgi:hypothetical protein
MMHDLRIQGRGVYWATWTEDGALMVARDLFWRHRVFGLSHKGGAWILHSDIFTECPNSHTITKLSLLDFQNSLNFMTQRSGES